jgi:hypothetical protein
MDTEQSRCALVDYAGLADQRLQDHSDGAISLGTTVTGTVKERTVADGSAEITIQLSISKALVFSVAGCDLASGPFEFGRRAQEVLIGATPSLGDAIFYARYIVPVSGHPLQDLVQIVFFAIPGEAIAETRLKARFQGQLRAAFGVPDGTPGKLMIKEKLVFDTARRIPARPLRFGRHPQIALRTGGGALLYARRTWIKRCGLRPCRPDSTRRCVFYQNPDRLPRCADVV